MYTNNRHKLEIENAQLMFRNFSGRERTAIINGRNQVVNDEGNRNFVVILDPINSHIIFDNQEVTDPDFGQELANLGFNVSVKPGKEEGDPVQYRLPVSIGYRAIPQQNTEGGLTGPQIWMIANGHKTLLNPDTIGNLDFADIENAKLVINNGKPYPKRDGGDGLRAWCNEGLFYVNRSRFAEELDQFEAD